MFFFLKFTVFPPEILSPGYFFVENLVGYLDIRWLWQDALSTLSLATLTKAMWEIRNTFYAKSKCTRSKLQARAWLWRLQRLQMRNQEQKEKREMKITERKSISLGSRRNANVISG